LNGLNLYAQIEQYLGFDDEVIVDQVYKLIVIFVGLLIIYHQLVHSSVDSEENLNIGVMLSEFITNFVAREFSTLFSQSWKSILKSSVYNLGVYHAAEENE